jgi:hypothetical protein|tara:strand:+ start:673 stop:777 length:105 start_codon:yes stop_codon:yes gene_type:complete
VGSEGTGEEREEENVNNGTGSLEQSKNTPIKLLL